MGKETIKDILDIIENVSKKDLGAADGCGCADKMAAGVNSAEGCCDKENVGMSVLRMLADGMDFLGDFVDSITVNDEGGCVKTRNTCHGCECDCGSCQSGQHQDVANTNPDSKHDTVADLLKAEYEEKHAQMILNDRLQERITKAKRSFEDVLVDTLMVKKDYEFTEGGKGIKASFVFADNSVDLFDVEHFRKELCGELAKKLGFAKMSIDVDFGNVHGQSNKGCCIKDCGITVLATF